MTNLFRCIFVTDDLLELACTEIVNISNDPEQKKNYSVAKARETGDI